jgi:LysR family transcriptional regulator, regulator for metE and metH
LFTYESLLAISNNHPLIKKTHLEPQDLTNQTLICYPVERDMLDIFTHFLELANVAPAALRHASPTIMMMQLAASDRGVCAMLNWALEEYWSQQYVSTKHLGSEGVWYTLYAAIGSDQ